MLNLEPLAAKAAANMSSQDPKDATNDENVITKSLMVLSEQGLFAFGLFLAARKRPEDKESAKRIHKAVTELLYETGFAKEKQPDLSPESPNYYRELTHELTHAGKTEDSVTALQRILLTKQLVEIALTYGRYHAKARTE